MSFRVGYCTVFLFSLYEFSHKVKVFMGILINFVFNEKDFSSFYILLSLINISFISDKTKMIFYL